MKKYFTPLLLVLVFITVRTTAEAQKEVGLFADSLRRGAAGKAVTVVAKDQYFYIGGQSHDSLNYYAYTPSVIKIDTSGQTIWSYTTNKQTDEEDNFFGGLVYGRATIDQLLLDGEFLYAVCFVTDKGNREIWKIDERTGNLVWKKIFKVYLDGLLTVRIADNDHLAIGYNASYETGYRYELVDKRDGKTSFSTTLPPLTDVQVGCFFEIDRDGSLYVCRYDSVFKYTTPTAATLQWSTRVEQVDINTLRFEGNTGLYVFGKSRSLAAAQLDKNTGAVVWKSGSVLLPYYLEDQVSDVKISNTAIYISGRFTYYGSVFSAYHVWKLDRTSGTTLWDKAFNRLWYQDTIPTGGAKYTAIVSLALDASENVYTTGFQLAGDNERGVWGVCKFDGASGSVIYQHAVYEDVEYPSIYSTGVFTYPYNNRVFYIGDLQKTQELPGPMSNFGYSNTFLLATDTSSTFRVQRKKKLVTPFQYFSKVASIKSFSATKYAVYKQLGPWGVVELRNSANGSLIWQRTLMRGVHFTADQLCVSADKKIAVTAFGHRKSNYYTLQYDYKKEPDSIYFLKLDSTGRLTDEKSFFYGERENFVPIQLYCTGDTNTVLVFNQKDVYGNPYSLHLFNGDKGTDPLGFSSYIAGEYAPIASRQQLLVPVGKDSALVVFKRIKSASSTALMFNTFQFKTNPYGSGLDPITLHFFNVDIKDVYNLAPIDTNSILFMGQTATGLATIARYEHKTRSLAWTNKEAAGYSILAASPSDKHVYWMGLNATGLVLRQSDLGDGHKNWEYNLSAGNQKYFVPQDQHFNALRKEYTVTGYLVDSASTVYRTPFYVTVDSLGGLKTFWVGTPDLNMENSLSAVEVSQYGQTLIGGAYYKLPYGRSGVLLEADSAMVQNVATSVGSVKAEHFSVTVLPNPVRGSTITLLVESKRMIPDLAIKLMSTNGAVQQTYRFHNVRTGKNILQLHHVKGRGLFYLQLEDKASQYTAGVLVL